MWFGYHRNPPPHQHQPDRHYLTTTPHTYLTITYSLTIHQVSKHSSKKTMASAYDDVSDDDVEISPISVPNLGKFKMKNKKMKSQNRLKAKTTSIHNAMPTKDTDVETLLRLENETPIPHILPVINGKKGRPKYPHRYFESWRGEAGAKDLKGKKYTPTSCSLFDNPLTMTNYGNDEHGALDDLMKNAPKSLHKKLNCFTKYYHESKFFVIDCDSVEAGEMCLKLPLLKNCPYTRSCSGKLHFYARRAPIEKGKASTLLATNAWSKSSIAEDAEKNIDFIYSTNVFELRYDESGKPRVVGNWDGKADSIPTISVGQIADTFGVKIPMKGTKHNEKMERNNSRAATKLLKEFEEKTWTNACFEVPAEDPVVEALLDAIPLDYLLSFGNWKKVAIVIKNQETGGKSFLSRFNKKMKQVFDSATTDNDTITTGSGKLERFPDWRLENDTIWKNIKEDYPYAKLTIKTLWDIVLETNRPEWAKIRRKQGGLPNERVMADMKYYEAQKKYFEEFAWFTIGDTEPLVSIRNYGTGDVMSLKTAIFSNQVWRCVKTYERVPKMSDGEKVLGTDGKPQMEDKLIGKFPMVWLDDKDKKRYEREVFLPKGFEHGEDEMARQGESDLIHNTWKGLIIEQHINAHDGGELLKAVEKRMAEDLEEHGDKYYGVARIRELLYFLCARERKTFDYVENWISFNILHPGLLTNTILLFRSLPGVGKNLFWDWLGNLIIGDKSYISSGNPQAFFEKHTTAIENKVLALVNEMNWKVMKGEQEVIKTRATEATTYLNPKNLPMRKVRNCCNMVMAMNGKNPPLEENQRRYCLIETHTTHKYKKDFFKNVAEDMRCQVLQVIYYKFMTEKIACPHDYPFERNLPKTAFHKQRQQQGMCPVVKFGKHLTYKFNRAEERGGGCDCQTDCDCIYGLVLKGADDTELGKFYKEWRKWAAEKGELGGEVSVKNHSSFKAQISSYSGKHRETKADRARWEKEEDCYCQFFIVSRMGKEKRKKVHFDVGRFCNFYAWNQARETGEVRADLLADIKSIGTTQHTPIKKGAMDEFVQADEDEEEDPDWMNPDPDDPATKW